MRILNSWWQFYQVTARKQTLIKLKNNLQKMKKIEFKQNDLKRGVPFAILYLGAVFAFFYIKYGGMLGMSDALESLGSNKIRGIFIFGLVVLLPFFVILNLLMPKLAIELYPNNVRITKNKKKQIVIDYKEISKLQLNVSNLNRLDFIDRQNTIVYHIQPQQKTEILGQIVSEISKHIEFIKQTGNKNYFGKNIETFTYTRK